MVCNWTPPDFTLLIGCYTHVWTAIRKKGVNLKSFALFDDRSSNQATLRNSNNTYLFVGEIRVIMNLVTHCLNLPLHPFKYGCRFSITNLDTFNNCLVVNLSLNAFNPTVNLWTVSIKTVKDNNRSDRLIIVCF